MNSTFSDYRCVATEACRVVINPEFFLTKVKETSGLNVDIISSEEEARLCLKSCKIHLKKLNNMVYYLILEVEVLKLLF